MRNTILILLIIAAVQLQAQVIMLDEKSDEITLAGYSYVIEDIEDNLSLQEALNSKWTYLEDDAPKFGYVKHYQWIKFYTYNSSKVSVTRTIFLPYNHLKEVVFYQLKNGEVENQATLGTTKSYSQKSSETRGYPFEFVNNPEDTLTFVLRLDNRSIPLRAATFILTNNSLNQIIMAGESLIWFWRGIFMFAIIVSLLLYLSIRLKLFLYYFIFTASVMLFIGTEIGDFFYFFDSDPYNYISDIKHVFNFLAIYMFPLFLNELTPLKKLNPKMWKWMYWTTIPLMILIPLGFIIPVKNSFLYLIIDAYMLTDAMLVLFFQLIFLIKASYYKKPNAFIIFGIYLFYITALCVSIILPAIGVKTETPLVNNALLIGSIFEVFTFIILIGKESIGIYRDRANLLEKQKFHQKEMLAAIVDSQEIERNRVGRELHDMVGANMSVIKQNLSKQDEKLRNIVTNTIDSVRNLSHGLITPRISSDEFVDEITELCLLASTDNLKIYPYFHKWEKLKSEEVRTHIFRIIQEFIQNGIKHSKAKKIYVQLIMEDKKISIMYEDDGVGFDHDKARKLGMGIKGIENRVELIKGKLEIASVYNNIGTAITITLDRV